MRFLILSMFMVLGYPQLILAFSEDQCYFYNSVMSSAPKCLKELNMLSPSIDEIMALHKKLLTPCMAQHKEATTAALLLGRKEIREKATCDEIIDEYILLFKKSGLSGKQIEQLPDDDGLLDSILDEMINSIQNK